MMRRAPGTLTETDITRQIRGMLKACRVMHYKAWGGPMSERGISDIIGCMDGKFFAIEVKRPGGRVSPDQEKFMERVREARGIAFVAYCVEDVIRELDLGVEINTLFCAQDNKRTRKHG